MINVRDIIGYLPERKQFIALSATYKVELLDKMAKYMKNPQIIRLSSDNPSLEGVKQYYKLIELPTNDKRQNASILRQLAFNEKKKALLRLLSQLRFHQCVVFCNQRDLANQLCNSLTKEGWSTRFIAGEQEQQLRQEAMELLREFKLRVLVSTDLVCFFDL